MFFKKKEEKISDFIEKNEQNLSEKEKKESEIIYDRKKNEDLKKNINKIFNPSYEEENSIKKELNTKKVEYIDSNLKSQAFSRDNANVTPTDQAGSLRETVIEPSINKNSSSYNSSINEKKEDSISTNTNYPTIDDILADEQNMNMEYDKDLYASYQKKNEDINEGITEPNNFDEMQNYMKKSNLQSYEDVINDSKNENENIFINNDTKKTNVDDNSSSLNNNEIDIKQENTVNQNDKNDTKYDENAIVYTANERKAPLSEQIKTMKKNESEKIPQDATFSDDIQTKVNNFYSNKRYEEDINNKDLKNSEKNRNYSNTEQKIQNHYYYENPRRKAINRKLPKIYSGFWIRGFAFIIDAIIVNSIIGILMHFHILDSIMTYENLFFAIAFSLYSFLTVLILNGQTIGKMIFGIKIVSDVNEKLDFLTILVREFFGKIILTKFMFLFVFLIFSDKKHHIIDFLASSSVIKSKDEVIFNDIRIEENEHLYKAENLA